MRWGNICAVTAFVSLSILCAAQTPDTATIRGQILDTNGRAISGADISVANRQTQLNRETRTNAGGYFSVAGLPVAGTYRIVASKPGFQNGQLDNVVLAGGTDATLRMHLNVSGGQTIVQVTGIVGDVRTDQPQLGDRLGAVQMENTPLLNRRITYLPLLNAANRPAINQGDVFMNQDLFTANGSGRRQTWFEIDGSTGNDSWGRQTIFTNIPVDAVQEITVIDNAFSAEYGFGLGSVVNIVTKSGGDSLHGQMLGLWRPSGTEAKLSGFTPTTATSGNDITNDTLYQGAASLSGPLGAAKKTQFFAAGQYSAQNRASPVISPLAPGNFIGHYRSWLAFLRVGRQINANNNLFLRSDVDSYYDTNPNGAVGGNSLPSTNRIFRKRTYAQEVGDTAVLSPNLLNNLRLQFQLASPITEFDPVILGTEFVVPISSGGTFSSGTSQSALLLNRQYEVNDTVAATVGRHQITFGGGLIYAHNGGDSKEYGGPIYDGEFLFKPCTLSPSVCESSSYLGNINNVQTYTQSYGNAKYTVDDALWALFAQDNFQFRPNLTVNLGLRYERQTFTDATKDFGPRVGFSYSPTRKANLVIQGGFGIYYAQVVDNSEANYALTGPTGVFNYTAESGMIGFPSSISAAPLPAFPPGAQVPLRSLYIRPGRAAYLNQYFPASMLRGYPDELLNPYAEQWIFGVEQQLRPEWVLDIDYVGSHTVKNVRPLDVDSPTPFIRTAQGQIRTAQEANCTRPYWIEWYRQHGMTCDPTTPSNPQPPYSVIQSDVNDGYAHYNALDVNLSHRFANRLQMLASYTWSHTTDNVDPDIPSQNPNDPNFTGKAEYGNAIFDQRNRFVLSGVYAAPYKISVGGVATLASGLPYNIVTGSMNSGDIGATTDRPVIDGRVIARNAGRGGPIYDISPMIERPFVSPSGRVQINVRAEAFNVLNHANFVGYSGTYGNGVLPGPGFGQPLTGITNQFVPREFQFSVAMGF
jgi:Carboxypeptidase regulatory-like domain/TonB dependent receptor